VLKLRKTDSMPRSSTALIPTERIERAILLLRGEKVMLDEDLAALYGVPVKVLVQAVKRNVERFPKDFAYHLNWQEFRNLKSQIVTSSLAGHGGRRKSPWVFIENGVAMLSSVLRSKRAIAVNIEIMRTFTRLRQLLASHAELSRRLEDLERKYDAQFKSVFDAIRALMKPDSKPWAEIGYHTLVERK
jgi:ORF6N domain